MAKKILLWTLYAGVVGLLVFGAVNRTSAKTGEGRPQGDARTEEQGARQPDRRPGGGGLENQDREAIHLAERQDHEWMERSGFVAAFDSDSLVIETKDGIRLEISGRTWFFVQAEGFELFPGDQVAMRGFMENGVFEVAEIHDLTTGAGLLIRDDSGTPLWSGRGR
jgi:hypothetical protein